jgi:hypothetical protein
LQGLTLSGQALFAPTLVLTDARSGHVVMDRVQ